MAAEQIYTFTKGLPGFDQLKDFSLKEHNEVFSLLSAVEQPEVTFITVNPFDFYPEYEFVLSDEAAQDVDREQLAVRCIVTWHSEKDKSTINLLAPLLFNQTQLIAKQVILQNTDYSTKHMLFRKEESANKGGDS